MFCPKCGKEIDKSDSFCRRCGTKIVPIVNENAGPKVQKNTVSCPECNGPLEPLDGLDSYICLHCGNKVMFSGMSDAAYDARVDLKKIEQEERMQKNILSHEKDMLKMKTDYIAKENKRQSVSVIVGVLVFFLFAFTLLFVFWIRPSIKKSQLKKQVKKLSEEVDTFIEDEDYDKASESNKRLKKKVEELTGDAWIKWMDECLEKTYEITLGERSITGEKPKQVRLKADLEDIDDLDRNDVVDYMQKQGFVNISCVSIKAKDYQDHYYEVDDITIEGDDDCYAGEVFNDDVEVVILILVH